MKSHKQYPDKRQTRMIGDNHNNSNLKYLFVIKLTEIAVQTVPSAVFFGLFFRLCFYASFLAFIYFSMPGKRKKRKTKIFVAIIREILNEWN